ncbi:hypothetical protein VKT23_015983 [Stygiomarasmius scandens]|uniref:Uncharacterized protein n=1 Tax=Marasmiellus scandens TaxID=2682957 RepID=A0ABR1IYK8_9AGAR
MLPELKSVADADMSHKSSLRLGRTARWLLFCHIKRTMTSECDYFTAFSWSTGSSTSTLVSTSISASSYISTPNTTPMFDPPVSMHTPIPDEVWKAYLKSILWDPETNVETPLPDMPDGIIRVYPAPGAVAMLPLTPPTARTPPSSSTVETTVTMTFITPKPKDGSHPLA